MGIKVTNIIHIFQVRIVVLPLFFSNIVVPFPGVSSSTSTSSSSTYTSSTITYLERNREFVDKLTRLISLPTCTYEYVIVLEVRLPGVLFPFHTITLEMFFVCG